MIRKLHICMLGHGFHTPWVEGYSAIAKQLASCLQNCIELSMLSYVRHDYVDGGVREIIRESNIHLVDSPFLRKPVQPTLLREMLLAFKFRRVLRRIDSNSSIDVLHLFNVSHIMNSILLGHLPRKKIVAHICDSGSSGYVFQKHIADAYICTTRSAQRHLIAQGFSPDTVFLIPPILSPGLFANTISTREKRIDSRSDRDELTITYIGNVDPRRFPPTIIDEFENTNSMEPGVIFQVCCPEFERNRSYIYDLNERARRSKNRWSINLVNLSEESKIQLYNSSDIVIFPFERDPGPMVNPPLTLLESMACGTLVVASNTSGINEVVTHGRNGYLVQPGNLPEFVDKVRTICHSYDELREVKEKAKDTIIKHYSPYTLSREVLNVYQTVLL